MTKLAQMTIRSTELSIAYSPCYKLAAFDGFQFIAKVFRQLAYNSLLTVTKKFAYRTIEKKVVYLLN